MLPWKCNNGIPLYCCRATKYFVLLSTVWTYWGLHVLCLMFLSDFNQIWNSSADFRKYSHPPIPNFAKIGRKEDARLHADREGWTDRHGEPILYKAPVYMNVFIFVCMYFKILKTNVFSNVTPWGLIYLFGSKVFYEPQCLKPVNLERTLIMNYELRLQFHVYLNVTLY